MKKLPIPVIRYLRDSNQHIASGAEMLKKPLVSGIAINDGEEVANEAIENYLKASPRAKKTEVGYRKDLTEFEAWVGIELADVRAKQIEDYNQHLVERKLKPATINRKISALKSFYEWLAIKGQIIHNPVTLDSKPVPKVIVQPLTLPLLR